MIRKPMLANSINPVDLPRYETDNRWWLQLKADGHRMLVTVDDGVVSVAGRDGKPKQTYADAKCLKQFATLPAGVWQFDGELVHGELLLFDMPTAPMVAPTDPYGVRYEALSVLVEAWEPEGIRILPCARTSLEKRAMAQTAFEEKREGVMLRDPEAPYEERRSSRLLKCKFTHEADVIVTQLNRDSKDNAVLCLIDADAGKLVEVGCASTIGKRPAVEAGSVWECRFLYLSDDGRLYQPRLIRKRTDKDMSECLTDQLAHAGTNKIITKTVQLRSTCV